jgi:multicomponent Na+:H+ antiporter subunit D
MPWSCGCYLIAAAAVSLPPFCGYVSKSMTLAAVGQADMPAAWLTLMAATVGLFWLFALRLAYQLWFRVPPEESASSAAGDGPWNQRVAMMLAAAACLALGTVPALWDRILPYEHAYEAYTLSHVVGTLQLVVFAAAAFVGLRMAGLYPFRAARPLWDLDVLFRWLSALMASDIPRPLQRAATSICQQTAQAAARITRPLRQYVEGDGRRGVFAPAGQMVLWATLMLFIILLAYYR